MYLGKSKRYFGPALVLTALALFFGAATFLGSRVTAQKTKQLPAPPPVPRYKPKPTPTPEPPEYEVIRVSSNLIVVPVSVIDANGQPVLGLKPADFRIEEDGQTQQVAQLGDPEQVPLDIALLVDVSPSVEDRFAFEQKAAADFLRQVLKAGDRATIFAIDGTPRFIQPLSSAEVAARQLMTLAASRKGFTAFFDSVLAAEKYLDQNSSSGRRRIIVVISDGDDTARIQDVHQSQSPKGNSRLSLMENQLRFIDRAQTQVLTEVQRGEATFYSINPSGRTMHLNVRVARAQTGMERIAKATGGAAFVPANESELPAIFQRIASEIRTQYLLQYYSDNKSAGVAFRRIAVNTPGQPQLRVRAREGYYPKAK